MDILFCSRGRGRGHAVRDLAIARELRVLAPEFDIGFASYSVGAGVFREAAETVYDLELPEKNDFPTTVVRLSRIVKNLKPSLVIAQEEPAALIASAVNETRSIFATHWFPITPKGNYRALEYAENVLFMEEAGIFAEPAQVRGRVRYCGPVLRKFSCDPTTTDIMRAQLDIERDLTFVLVLPGSPPEAREPIFDLVVSAFALINRSPKRMLWVGGKDYMDLYQRARGMRDIQVIEHTKQIDQLILASNIVITKGTYNLSREVMALGRPSISLTHHYNWVDDLFASRWTSNKPISVSGASAISLEQMITEAIGKTYEFRPDRSLLANSGARVVASEIMGCFRASGNTKQL
jgi:hypothetical protein